ncbi:hypothetical protein P153DRAFT_418903 [Dothidotthia symphoricarpi CBS 119687]|uniref:Uncharacterized protein n=1 Tax=Dothidotthia symphoricarpi CBS 119687 TaxID=1392245 RepID=A0A6A6AI97_9PLEO|nr:uncharacterized protein P153DRAFT_418903 [Dothidotthia symphoricarpi CBS 119687]KAF2130151.1 hypothetical protein P153DRAFT_418903 [Dothidotthia symphoricarpi CBS 119687]
MKLLDLPPELCQHIAHILVKDVGIAKAARYRLVCKTFATGIHANFITRQNIEDLLAIGPRNHFISMHSGTILRKRLSLEFASIAKPIQELVDKLLSYEDSHLQPVRGRYMNDVCNVILGDSRFTGFRCLLRNPPSSVTDGWSTRKTLPPAAAAVGDLSLLKSLVTFSKGLFKDPHRYFASALNAAVVNGKLKIVEWILSNAPTDNPRLCIELIDPLLLAAQTFNNETGGLILDFLSAEFQLRANVSKVEEISWRMELVVVDCMKFGNIDFLLRVLQYRKTVDPSYADLEASNGLPISTEEVSFLFREGSRSGLIALLRVGILDLNRMGSHLPLDQAVRFCRYDLAHVILNHGVDIEMRDKGCTALQLAVDRRYIPAIQFLIENGANPDSVGVCIECRLIQVAKVHAQGQKLDRAAWREFWQLHRHDALARTWDDYEAIVRNEHIGLYGKIKD